MYYRFFHFILELGADIFIDTRALPRLVIDGWSFREIVAESLNKLPGLDITLYYVHCRLIHSRVVFFYKKIL